MSKMRERINEFGETIMDAELEEFARRVRKLADKKIDEFWYLCGFIIEDHEYNLKALRQNDIDRIRKSLASAKEVVWNLLAETPIKDFKENLAKAEKV